MADKGQSGLTRGQGGVAHAPSGPGNDGFDMPGLTKTFKSGTGSEPYVGTDDADYVDPRGTGGPKKKG